MLAERKAAELQSKLRSIGNEFKQWEEEADRGAFRRHHSQIRGVILPLRAVLNRVATDLKEKAGDDLLSAAPQATQVILGIFRVWEFFRQKWIQRRDPELRKYLDIADEFAWICYQPVIKDKNVKVRRPPLVFLNGGLSPFVLNRLDGFHLENENDGELQKDKFRAILAKLPFPVIGVPWHQLEFWPEVAVIAHEVGHAVERDLQLEKDVTRALTQAIGKSPRRPYWQAWRGELFADAYGCAAVGPASAGALADYLARSRTDMESESPSAQDEHPPGLLRIEFNQSFLEVTGHSRLDGWPALDKGPIKPFAQEAHKIAEAFSVLLKKRISFSKAKWKSAGERAQLASRLVAPPPDERTDDVLLLIASIRRLFESMPCCWNEPSQESQPN